MQEDVADAILHHSGLVHSERPALVYERTAFRVLDAGLLPGKFKYIDFTSSPDGPDVLNEVCSYLQRHSWLETSTVTSVMVLFLASKVVNYATKSRLLSKEQLSSLIAKDVAIFTKRCPWAAQTAVKLKRIARIVKEVCQGHVHREWLPTEEGLSGQAGYCRRELELESENEERERHTH